MRYRIHESRNVEEFMVGATSYRRFTALRRRLREVSVVLTPNKRAFNRTLKGRLVAGLFYR